MTEMSTWVWVDILLFAKLGHKHTPHLRICEGFEEDEIRFKFVHAKAFVDVGKIQAD